MKRLTSIAFVALWAISGCGGDTSLGSSSDPNALTTSTCETCDTATYPENLVCPQGAKAGCFKRQDGACGWSSRCPGDTSGGTVCDCANLPIPEIACASGKTTPVCSTANGKCGWSITCDGGGTDPGGCTDDKCGGQPRIACPTGQKLTCLATSNAVAPSPSPGPNPAPMCGWKCAGPTPPPCDCSNQPVPAIGCQAGEPKAVCVVSSDGACKWNVTCGGGGGMGCACSSQNMPTCPPNSKPECIGAGGTANSCGWKCSTVTPPTTCVGPNPAQQCRGTAQCIPSSCGCDAATKSWVCTADCGSGIACDAKLAYYYTCGDPVCGGARPNATIPPCKDEKVGAACLKEGALCNPGNDQCNRMIVCASSDPTKAPGGCPR